jgi:hypothetical protein
MLGKLHKIIGFDNKMVAPDIISSNQVEKIVHGLLSVHENNKI